MRRARIIVTAAVFFLAIEPRGGWADDCAWPLWFDSLTQQTLEPSPPRALPIDGRPWLVMSAHTDPPVTLEGCVFESAGDGPIVAEVLRTALDDAWVLVSFVPERSFLPDREYTLACEGSVTSILGGELAYRTRVDEAPASEPVDLAAARAAPEPASAPLCCRRGPSFTLSLAEVEGASALLRDGGHVLVTYEDGSAWILAGDEEDLSFAIPDREVPFELRAVAADGDIGPPVGSEAIVAEDQACSVAGGDASPSVLLVVVVLVAPRARRRRGRGHGP